MLILYLVEAVQKHRKKTVCGLYGHNSYCIWKEKSNLSFSLPMILLMWFTQLYSKLQQSEIFITFLFRRTLDNNSVIIKKYLWSIIIMDMVWINECYHGLELYILNFQITELNSIWYIVS